MASKHEKNAEMRKLQKRPVSRPFAMPCKGWRAVIACAVIATAAIAAYHNSLYGGLFFDNKVVILDNEILKAENGVGKIFSSNYWAPGASDLYRPLTMYTYYINYKVWGWEAKPYGYHVCNLLLHMFNGFLVFLLVSRISGRALIGAFTALLFVTHPVTTEAVTNVVGRADLMAMFFVLLALLLHLSGSVSTSSRHALFYAGAALCLGLGLLSKENAIAGIAVLAAFDLILLWPKIRAKEGDIKLWRWLFRRLYTCYVFCLVIVAGWFLARYLVLSAQDPSAVYVVGFCANPLDYAPFFQREATAIVVLGLYFWRLIWPVTLSADYSYNQIPIVTSPASSVFVVSLAAVLVAVVLGLTLWKKSPVTVFFIWFFFICIAPVSNIFITIGTIGAERLLYMPSLAWCGLAAIGLLWSCGKLGERRLAAAVAVMACIIGLYSYRTIVRNFDWQNMKAFWRANAEASPNSVITVIGYADSLIEDDPQEALKWAKRAVAIDDTYLKSYVPYMSACIEWSKKIRAEGPGDPEKALEAREVLLDGFDKMQHWHKTDNEILKEMRRRYSAKGGHLSDFVPAGLFEARIHQAALAIYIAETYPKESEMYAYYNNEAIRYARAAILLSRTNPEPNLAMAEALRRNAELLPTADPRRQELLGQAATASMRAILMSRGKSARAFGLLGGCYEAMGLDPQKLLVGPDGGGNFRFAQGEKLNDKYMRLAARSLVMIELAAGRKKGIDTLVISAIGFGVPRADIEPLLTQSFSRDDENIWVGE